MSGISAALGDLLPAALGVAISPIPIIATVLMLLSARSHRTAPAFAAGWMVGITAVLVIVLLVAGPDGVDTTSSSDTTFWIQTALGLLFLLLAANTLRKRPRNGQASAPAWMNTLNSVSPVAALGLGALLSAANPKNLALAVTGAVAIASNDLSTPQTVACVLMFVIVGSLFVTGPVVAHLVAPERMSGPLDALRGFMQSHNTAIMVVLLGVLGLSSLGKGIGGLLV